LGLATAVQGVWLCGMVREGWKQALSNEARISWRNKKPGAR
jgi:hypothetical protein